MKHIIVYVVQTAEDLFLGIKRDLQKVGPGHTIYEVRLSDSQYETVRRWEFSSYRLLRILRYRELFQALTDQVVSIVEGAEASEPVVIYGADEAVWGELLQDIKARLSVSRPVLLVNVQHGFVVQQARFMLARRVFNALSRTIFGFPGVGLGCGGSMQDLYVVYSGHEREFLEAKGVGYVVVAPYLIKTDLVERVQSSPFKADGRTVLVVLPACVTGSEMKCTLREFLEMAAPLIRALVTEFGLRVVVRPHPGQGPEPVISAMRGLGMLEMVEIDRNPHVADSLSASSLVLGAHSTVLFEATVVGLTAVAVRSRCYEDPVTVPHVLVDMRGDYRTELKAILSDGLAPADEYFSDDRPWLEILASTLWAGSPG